MKFASKLAAHEAACDDHKKYLDESWRVEVWEFFWSWHYRFLRGHVSVHLYSIASKGDDDPLYYAMISRSKDRCGSGGWGKGGADTHRNPLDAVRAAYDAFEEKAQEAEEAIASVRHDIETLKLPELQTT